MHPSAVLAPPASTLSTRALAWWRTGDRPLLATLLAAHLAPLALVPIFPTRDGPTHLEGALMLLRYHQPAGAVLREWFTWELPLAPNWLDHALLASFALFLPVVVAEKLLVAVFVAGLPLAARRALVAVRPDAGFLAVLVFPFTYTWLLHMGFYNFCLSLPLFFLTIASWLRQRGTLPPAGVARLAGWSTLLYFTHPVALCAAAAALLALAGWDGALEVREGRARAPSLRAALGRGLRPLAHTALAFLPAALLLGRWLGGRRSPAYERLPWRQLLEDLLRLDVLVTFTPAEAVPAAALALVFAALAAAVLYARGRRPAVTRGDAWLLCAAGFLVVYLGAPGALVGGSYLTPRLALFPYFALLLWLASGPWSAPARARVGAAALAVSVPFLALHARSYGHANELLREYLSAEPWVDHGQAVLPLHFAGPRHAYPRVDVLAHAAAYLGVSCGTVDLSFYEGMGRGVFPLAFRRELNPHRQLHGNLESIPPCVDVDGFRRRTGRPIDVVLTWKEQRRDGGEPCVDDLLAQLRASYEVVYTSSPRGLLRVWRLQGS